jgi:hypothetical protein
LCDFLFKGFPMNHLATSTSPYLLQHASNPVDWYPWSEEALAKARAENKPIFLSIGYAACHWCHVMAHESFEDEVTAATMNENFICIKVDREERPDLDGIYMAAVVALTGGGGWPMSVFLTPDLVPFYGGTYFPPVARYNLPSFRDLLASIAEAWTRRRDEIDRVGAQLAEHLTRQAAPQAGASAFTADLLDLAEQNLVASYDWGYGGWGAAPKFPQAMTIDFLLARSVLATETTERTEKNQKISVDSVRFAKHPIGAVVDSPALKASVHALKAMARGGMYDVVGGGFSRYSTDNFWRVPHFEKMLYDNALLVRAYLHAWQITGEPSFRRVGELTHPEGGFFSSLDADSEGVEGKFYVWTREEIRVALEKPGFSLFDLFEAAYGITERGNWEGKTVLQRAPDDDSLATRFKLDPEAVAPKLAECHAKLLSVRATRVRPGTDDKILTAWNGLMLAACAEAARSLGEHAGSPQRRQYHILATRNAEFLLTHLRHDGMLHRSWRDERTTSEVFLEDYAALILGLIELYQTDFNNRWFVAAMELAEEMIERFSDPAGGFFDTPNDGETLLVRPKDIQDNATPSGNALAAEALLKLASFSGRGDFRDLAEQSLQLVTGFAAQYPTGFARWLGAGQLARTKVKQVAIVGKMEEDSTWELIRAVWSGYRPDVVIAAGEGSLETGAPALLVGREARGGESTAYVCEGFVCRLPVTNATDLVHQLEENGL